MNLSETAFLHPVGDGFSLRCLTPLMEAENPSFDCSRMACGGFRVLVSP
jgi:hypothetical protein